MVTSTQVSFLRHADHADIIVSRSTFVRGIQLLIQPINFNLQFPTSGIIKIVSLFENAGPIAWFKSYLYSCHGDGIVKEWSLSPLYTICYE